ATRALPRRPRPGRHTWTRTCGPARRTTTWSRPWTGRSARTNPFPPRRLPRDSPEALLVLIRVGGHATVAAIAPSARSESRSEGGRAMRQTFQGSLVAMVTPFQDGKVDEAKLRELVEFHVANGTDGLVPCGTTGESPTLTHEEHKRVVEIVIHQSRGRIP